MTIICSECKLPRNIKTCVTRYAEDGTQNGFTCKVCIKKFMKRGQLRDKPKGK